LSSTRSTMCGAKGFSGSGADWLERFRLFNEDSSRVVVRPHIRH
jgi:hypothetical protein